MRKLWHAATANKRRRIIAAGTTLLVIAASAAAYIVILSGTSGTGSGNQTLGSTPCSGCTQNQAVNIALIASWPDGMNPSLATSPAGQPFTMTANNATAYDGHVKTVTLTTIKSSNAGCETLLSGPAQGGIALGWPDGTVAGGGAGLMSGVTASQTYTFTSAVTVPAGSSGTVLLGSGFPGPNGTFAWWINDPGTDQSACLGKPIELDFTASS